VRRFGCVSFFCTIHSLVLTPSSFEPVSSFFAVMPRVLTTSIHVVVSTMTSQAPTTVQLLRSAAVETKHQIVSWSLAELIVNDNTTGKATCVVH
jgi:hypothetical protein